MASIIIYSMKHFIYTWSFYIREWTKDINLCSFKEFPAIIQMGIGKYTFGFRRGMLLLLRFPYGSMPL